jgi:glucose/arabinose dehydrogenase
LQYVLTEWKTKQPDKIPFTGEGRELFRIDMVTGIHGVQEIIFNPLAKKGDEDYGLLYIGIGDGGGSERGFPFLVSRKDAMWGTVLRIDPTGRNSRNGKYGIPQSNPFTKTDALKTNPEIYAYGFRNPHRITWSQKGEMLVTNIGHHNIESLCLVKPGYNFGWPFREGSFVINPSGNMRNVYPLPDNDMSLVH